MEIFKTTSLSEENAFEGKNAFSQIFQKKKKKKLPRIEKCEAFHEKKEKKRICFSILQ